MRRVFSNSVSGVPGCRFRFGVMSPEFVCANAATKPGGPSR